MSFQIRTLPVGQLTTNCYLVIDGKTKKALIIDPGDSAEYIINVLRDEGATPTAIVATHGHFDHILAVTELKLAFNIPFLINGKDRFLVARMQESARHFLKIEVDPPPALAFGKSQWRAGPPQIDGTLKNKIKAGSTTLTILETPGHTPGSVCLYHKEKGILFTGDTLFANGGVGRTDFSYSSKNDLNRSLQHLFKLPLDTIIYPGHGESSTLSQEYRHHF